MQPQQIALVRSSFDLVQPIAADAAAIFYRHLFTADPSLQPLFKGSIVKQGELLMNMIAAAVHILDKPQALLPVLSSLGARHQRYGVRDEHYATVGAALIQTLSDGLGEAFTAEVREAWLAMYGVVSRTMMAAAQHQACTDAEAATAAG